MALEIPDMALGTMAAAEGDVYAWYNAALKLVDGLGGLVSNHLDKNNIKMLKNEIENIGQSQQNNQEMLEQKLWQEHLTTINNIKEAIREKRAETQQRFTEENIAKFSADNYSAKIEEIRSDARIKLNEAIQLIDEKLTNLINEDEKEKKQFLEYKRLLLIQYNKLIFI